MAKWIIQDTDKEEECSEEGYKRINALRNRFFKNRTLVFVDDNGVAHADINSITAARKAGLLPKKKDVHDGKGAPGRVGAIRSGQGSAAALPWEVNE